MPRSKKKKSDRDRTNQKTRTKRNNIMKYEKLLSNFPNSPDIKTWQKKLEELR